MTISTRSHQLDVITVDQTMGDALAAAVFAALPGDFKMFSEHAMPCYPTGTTFDAQHRGSTAAVAWATSVACVQAVADAASEFIAGGYPPALLAAGWTNASIDTARTKVFMQVRTRDDSIDSLTPFITSRNLVTP